MYLEKKLFNKFYIAKKIITLMAIAYITCKDRSEAKKISMCLLKKKLIGCTNIFPIESIYWWNNKIETAKEFVIIAKTTKNDFDKIVKETEKIHSYDVPCILSIKSSCNAKFERWLKGIVN